MAANDKVMFKFGTQASVNEILAGTKNYQVGTFYLTSDSDRLYVGQAGGLKLLNKSVRVIQNEAELESLTTKHPDDFVYLSKENILAVYNGTKWTQINPDTDTVVTAITKAVGDVSGGVKVTEEITNKTGKTDSTVTANEISITGEKGAQVAKNGNTGIKITGDTYTLSSTAPDGNAVDVTLTSALGQAASTINVSGGENITISGSANDLTIAAKDTVLKTVDVACPANGKGELTVTVADTAGNSKSGMIKLGYKIDGKSYYINDPTDLPVYTKEQVNNRLNTLNPMRYMGTIGKGGTYSLDSSYKVLNTNADVVNVCNGDMFLVAGEVTYAAGKVAKKGDLLIAQGTEDATDANGVTYISGTINWEWVPSGNDQTLDTSTLFKVDTSTNKMTVYSVSNLSSEENQIGLIQLEEGTGIDLVTTTNDTTANQLITTISHSNVDCATSTDTTKQLKSGDKEFTVVKELNINGQGHATKLVTQNIKAVTYLPGPDAVSDLTGLADGTTGVKLKHNLYENGTDLVEKEDAYTQIISSSLEVKKGTAGSDVSIDLVWGSF